MVKSDEQYQNIETKAIHHGVYKDSTWNSVTTPIYPSSTFAFEKLGQHKGFDYTRSGNPTRQALQDNIAALEGGSHAWTTSTGMSAITSTLFLLKAGDHLIAGHDIYSGTIRLLQSVMPKMGIETSFVKMSDLDAVRQAIRPNTRALMIETPSNPMLRLVDIRALTTLAREHKLLSFVDNTFMSPCFQKPLSLGADLVIHSTTKYLNGHSDIVGGAIVVNDPDLAEQIGFLVNALGTANSPFDAWLVLRGIKTLPVRMQSHQRNALAVAGWLKEQKNVKAVYYPGLSDHPDHELAKRQMTGFGGMVSFDLDTDKISVEQLIGRMTLFCLAESLGGVESLIEHPWSMSHSSISEETRQAAGISPATIRLSLGIEHPDDLIADLQRGLQ